MSRAQQRGVGVAIVDPRIIRAALDAHRAGDTLTVAARSHGINIASLTRWKRRQHLEATRGIVWPSDEDIAEWDERRIPRQRRRRQAIQYRLRVAAQGKSRIDPTGTTRRIQALCCTGWRMVDLAELLGSTEQYVSQLATRRAADTVLQATAARVADVYEQLSLTDGPSERAARYAARKGWAPPWAWIDQEIDDPAARPAPASSTEIDEVLVMRAVHGEPVQLNMAERKAAVRQMRARGLGAKTIARQLGLNIKQVERVKAVA
jgi:transcriptional regulator